MKQFTEVDVKRPESEYPKIYCDKSELVLDQPRCMQQGLQETAGGYGARLNSGLKIHYNGRLYRIYVTRYGNAGSSWFVSKGRKIWVDCY